MANAIEVRIETYMYPGVVSSDDFELQKCSDDSEIAIPLPDSKGTSHLLGSNEYFCIRNKEKNSEQKFASQDPGTVFEVHLLVQGIFVKWHSAIPECRVRITDDTGESSEPNPFDGLPDEQRQEGMALCTEVEEGQRNNQTGDQKYDKKAMAREVHSRFKKRYPEFPPYHAIALFQLYNQCEISSSVPEYTGDSSRIIFCAEYGDNRNNEFSTEMVKHQRDVSVIATVGGTKNNPNIRSVKICPLLPISILGTLSQAHSLTLRHKTDTSSFPMDPISISKEIVNEIDFANYPGDLKKGDRVEIYYDSEDANSEPLAVLTLASPQVFEVPRILCTETTDGKLEIYTYA